MNFDRGFVKWQPFNSVVPSKVILNNMSRKEKKEKPNFFPEVLENLNELVKEAYYSQNKVHITFFEQNQVKEIEAIITKINPVHNTLELNHHKTITFNQIMNII